MGSCNLGVRARINVRRKQTVTCVYVCAHKCCSCKMSCFVCFFLVVVLIVPSQRHTHFYNILGLTHIWLSFFFVCRFSTLPQHYILSNAFDIIWYAFVPLFVYASSGAYHFSLLQSLFFSLLFLILCRYSNYRQFCYRRRALRTN